MTEAASFTWLKSNDLRFQFLNIIGIKFILFDNESIT